MISSPSTMLAKIGPGRNSNLLSDRFQTVTPTTSDGNRSGVNCMRPNDVSSDLANALAKLVLPTPGTSSMRRWPSETRHKSTRSTTSDLPCIARWMFAEIASKNWANRVVMASVCCVANVGRVSFVRGATPGGRVVLLG